MPIEDMKQGKVKSPERIEKERLLSELENQFSDFQRPTQVDVIETLKTIAPMIHGVHIDKISFSNALSRVPIKKMENHEPNVPPIAKGISEWLYLLSSRDNGKVGSLSFEDVKLYLENSFG